MQLNKMTVNNFRQFYGTHEIEFAKGNKNITIFLGENGAGKTAIFRALIYSLFGQIYIAQDNQDVKLNYLNLKALNNNNGGPTVGSVSIQFESRNIEYKLERTFSGVRMNNEVSERTISVKLFQKSPTGDYNPEPITDIDEINMIVNKIVDENTKDFFFFDGEQIDHLSKTDNDIRKEVKDGIVKLLRIDEIQKAIDVLSNLSSNEKTRITRESKDLDLGRKSDEADKIQNKINERNILKNEREKEVTVLKNEINELKNKLNQSQEIIELVRKKENYEDNKQMRAQYVTSKKDILNKILKKDGVNYLLSNYYVDINNYLNEVASNQEDLVSITAINKSINDNKCVICGNNLLNDEHAMNHVIMRKHNYKSDELTKLITIIQEAINDYQQNSIESLQELDKEINSYREAKESFDSEVIKIEEIEKVIKEKANSESNLKDDQKSLDSKEEELKVLSAEIMNDNNIIEELTKNKVNAEKEFQELLGQNKSLKLDKDVLEFIDSLKDEFLEIFNTYSDNMRIMLGTEATNIFKKLISAKDRDLVNRVNINEKYEIEVIGWDDTDITADISQGQRQIVSLSFITALSKVAKNNFEDDSFPLFMDTPFGRISGDNRDQLIENIPELTSQWILLLTDTELTSTEEKVFKETKRLGKWYLINKIENYHSEIIEIDTSKTISNRG